MEQMRQANAHVVTCRTIHPRERELASLFESLLSAMP